MKSIFFHFTGLAMLAIVAGCTGRPQSAQNENMNEATTKEDKKETFGFLPDGTQIDAYTFKNSSNNMEMRVINYGGIITHLKVPDKEGNVEDVVLGYDTLQGYLDQSPYFGAIAGRYGNRIAKGRFTLEGETYALATNNGVNHLHGGDKGFDKAVWSVEQVFYNPDSSGIVLKYISPDGEEGYPGTLTTFVTYTLTEDEVHITYEATTDKTTVVNLTQHTYFNLSGDGGKKILDHKLMLNANRYLPVDSTLIPTGELRSVQGTPFDFTTAKNIGTDINIENQQLAYGLGYDHCWVLNEDVDINDPAAVLYHQESGRVMSVFTEEPAIQFYSGNFLDGSITGKKGKIYKQRTGLCLETQHFPNSPNTPDFPGTELHPGEKYKTKTVYRFSIDKSVND